MNISELFTKNETYRKEFSRALFGNCEDIDAGFLMNATQLNELIDRVTAKDGVDTASFVLKAIVSALVEVDPEKKVLAVKNTERGLLVYGFKVGIIGEPTQFDSDGVGTEFDWHPAMFGMLLPEGVRLQIESEKVGTGDKEYSRPVAKLMLDYQDAKGKTRTAILETGVADTVKAMRIEYFDWVKLAVTCKDEDDLIARSLIAEWAEPKLGSGGGQRVNLVDLGKNADQFGPQVYQILEVKEVNEAETKSKFAEVGFSLQMVGAGNEPFETWNEKIFAVSRTREKGGIGYSDMVGDALGDGQPYYLIVLGSKAQTIWDKASKKAVVRINESTGEPWMCVNGYMSSRPTIAVNLLTQVKSPAIQAANTIAPAQALKPAAISEEDFADIPF